MARKIRDYKAEERRRNEIARALGYRNRAEMRRAIELGKIAPRRPKAVRSPRTIAAQKYREVVESRAYGTPDVSGDSFDVSFGGRITAAQRAADWSAAFARTDVARFEYGEKNAQDSDSKTSASMRAKEDFIKRFGKQEYLRAYMAAFVEGPQRYKYTRKTGSAALFFWFVVVTQYMTADEYDIPYGDLGV